jgi:hypothetical protein
MGEVIHAVEMGIFGKTNQLRIGNYGLLITNYELSITNGQLRMGDYELTITDYGLSITNYQLRITNGELRITNYGSSIAIKLLLILIIAEKGNRLKGNLDL